MSIDKIVGRVTIADSASLSDALDLTGDYSPVAIVCPAGMEGTSMTFNVSVDGGLTYYNLYASGGSEYSITVAESRAIILNPSDFIGISNLKIRTGTAGAPTAQTGAAEILVVLRTIA